METIFDYIILGIIVVGALYVFFGLCVLLYGAGPTKDELEIWKELDKDMDKNDKNVQSKKKEIWHTI